MEYGKKQLKIKYEKYIANFKYEKYIVGTELWQEN